MRTNHQTTGQKIRNERLRQGKSQQAVANSAGITNVQLCRIENDRVNAKHATLKRIAKALKIGIQEL